MSDDDLAAEVRRLREEVAALHRRIEHLEEATGVDPPATDERVGDASPESHPDDTPTSDATADGERGRRAFGDLERDLGIKWLGLVGGAALVVGVVYFIRLAIEAGLLGPLGRVVLGTVGGLALFVGGRVAASRRGYVRWGRIAAGAGLAVAYVSVYAAYGFESYRETLGTPLWAVLLGLTLLVGGTAALSVRDGAPVVAGEAFLLGYVTAYLGLDAGTFLLTPVYALALAAGLVAIVPVRPWSRHVLSSVLPTYGTIAVWALDLDPTESVVAAVVATAFGIYLAGGYLLRSAEPTGRLDRLFVAGLTLLNAVLAAFGLEATLRNWVSDAPVEGVAFALVGLALVGAYAATAHRPVRRDDTAGALSVVLAGGSVLLAAGPFASTVGLLALVVVGVGTAHVTGAAAFRTGAHIVAAGAAFKLLVVDATDLPAFDAADPLAAATSRAVAFALGIAVAYGLAWWFRDRTVLLPRTDTELPVAAPYAWAGTVLAVVLLWLELSGLGVSVAWALFGFALLGAGLLRDVPGLRLQGIAVLGLTTAKVFLYDTRDLDTLARTLSFLVLGAILLAASYAYARWQGQEPLDRFVGD